MAAPPEDHACRYIRDIERMILKLDILTATVEQRLEKGEQRFQEVEDKLDVLSKDLQERLRFESKIEGGYKLLTWMLTVMGTLAAVLTIPHFWQGK